MSRSVTHPKLPVAPLRTRRRAFWILLVLVGALLPRAGTGLDRDTLPTPFTPERPAKTDAPAPDDTAPATGNDANIRSKSGDEPPGPKRHTPSTRAITFADAAGKRVIHIKIGEVIDLGLAPFVERILAEAADSPDVVAVIAEIDTPGGRVDAAVRIRDALLRSKVRTVAYINTQAISAGALIAYAHDIIAVTEGGSMGAATPVQMGSGGDAEPVSEKVTSYMRAVMRATAEAKERDGDIAEAMVDADIEVPGVSPKGRLLTATHNQLIDYGIADVSVANFADLLTKLGLEGTTLERRTSNWAEDTARVLTHPVVSSLLMTFGFLGILMEFYTPGFGVTGILGIVFLAIFFAGHLIVNLAGLEEILLFVAGAALLFVEIFVTPGFGVLGVLGVLAILGSLVLALIGLPLDVSLDSGELVGALARVSFAGLCTLAAAVLAVRFLPRSTPFRRLVLTTVSGAPGAPTVDHALGNPAASALPADCDDARGLVGAVGTALSDLRPAGRALVADRRLDVVSDGDFIPRGAAVEVIEATPLRVVVRATRTAEAAHAAATQPLGD